MIVFIYLLTFYSITINPLEHLFKLNITLDLVVAYTCSELHHFIDQLRKWMMEGGSE